MNKHFLEINLAVFLLSLPGLISKIIPLPPISLTAYRVMIASIIIFLIIKLSGKKPIIKFQSKRDILIILLMGILITIHWVAIFFSVYLSTVAIGALSLFTYPIMTAILEPWFFHEKHIIKDIIPALISFFGIYLILPSFDIHQPITQGVIFGLISALTFSIRTIINRKYIHKYSSDAMMLYQTIIASIILFPFVIIEFKPISIFNILLLLFLGIFCTGIAHTLYVRSLKKIKATTVGIISCVQPLYAIIFATIVIHEIPSMKVLLGGLIILLVAGMEMIKHNFKKQEIVPE